jgi:hypothetical protein
MPDKVRSPTLRSPTAAHDILSQLIEIKALPTSPTAAHDILSQLIEIKALPTTTAQSSNPELVSQARP